MCRLFGYVAPGPTTVESTIGQAAVDEFAKLSCVHGDGWGTAWLDQADGQRGYLSPRPAESDPEFRVQTAIVASRARIVHLRWATPGLPIRTENTHPFTAGGMSFAHNGSLMPPANIEAMLDPEFSQGLAGTTDSERYFALIRQELSHHPGDTVAAVRRAVLALREPFPIASLNALLLSRTELIVVHANSIEDIPALPDRGVTPLDHGDAYFLMRWRRTAAGAMAFTSSGLPADGWRPLPEHTITRVDLDALTMTTESIHSPATPQPHDLVG